MYRSTVCLVALALLAAAGCGQYLGHRVEKTEESASGQPQIVERGQPKQLEVQLEAEASGAVAVHVQAVGEDLLAQKLVTEEKRVRVYSKYDPGIDLLSEYFAWIAGWLGVVPAFIESDWHEMCMWPPIDLIARLLGSYGSRKCSEINRPYEANAPYYPRRLVHWFAWVLPGYSFGQGVREKVVTASYSRLGAHTWQPRKQAAAGAAVTLKVDGVQAAEVQTDDEGTARIDISKQIRDVACTQQVTLRAIVEYQGISQTQEKTVAAAQLGVTRTEPIAPEPEPQAPKPAEEKTQAAPTKKAPAPPAAKPAEDKTQAAPTKKPPAPPAARPAEPKTEKAQPTEDAPPPKAEPKTDKPQPPAVQP